MMQIVGPSAVGSERLLVWGCTGMVLLQEGERDHFLYDIGSTGVCAPERLREAGSIRTLQQGGGVCVLTSSGTRRALISLIKIKN